MRQGQQNRRGRGRGRKSTNPLTRSYESNGPDVKIRGTAAHIAEKYISLARDSLAGGDVVQAEAYLQHAEHYNRIIMSSQPSNQPNQHEGTNGANQPRARTWSLDSHLDSDDEGDEDGAPDFGQQHQSRDHARERDGGQRRHGRRQGRSQNGDRGTSGDQPQIHIRAQQPQDEGRNSSGDESRQGNGAGKNEPDDESKSSSDDLKPESTSN